MELVKVLNERLNKNDKEIFYLKNKIKRIEKTLERLYKKGNFK